MFGSGYFGSGYFGSYYWGAQEVSGPEYLYLEIHFNGVAVQQVALVRPTTYNYAQAMGTFPPEIVTFRA